MGFMELMELVGRIIPPSTVVGLSIGTSSIKLIELKQVRKKWNLIHFGIVQLPESAIVNREIVNTIAVVDSIKTLLSQIKLKTQTVCTALSGNSVIIKRMNLEVQNMSELQDQVFWEAEQYLPFNPSEVVMDYQLISKNKDIKKDIILVAVKKAVIESYMGCIEEAGLRPKVVDVDFFALQNLFELSYPQSSSEAVAIIDIGASAIKLVIVHDGIPIFTKDAGIGGAHLTAEIQKRLNLSFLDAETLKIGGGQQGQMPQEVSDLIRMMSENFAMEIKRALDFYNASSTGAPVSYVLLAGGSSNILGLSKIIEDTINIPTQLMNPFQAISYDPNIFTTEYINSIASVAVVPIGLALRASKR